MRERSRDLKDDRTAPGGGCNGIPNLTVAGENEVRLLGGVANGGDASSDSLDQYDH